MASSAGCERSNPVAHYDVVMSSAVDSSIHSQWPDGPALLGRILLFGVAYAAASGFGQLLAFLPPGNITAVFPASGLAVAVLLRGGWRYWPGIWIGSFLANARVLIPNRPYAGIACAAAIASGAALQALIASASFRRVTGHGDPFRSAAAAATFVVLGALAGCLLNPFVGTVALTLAGFDDWSHAKELWTTWWLGDASGVLVVAPVVLAWSSGMSPRHWRERWPELILLPLLSAAVCFAVVRTRYPLEFLYLPILTWSALRFGPRGATTMTALIAGVAAMATVQRYGSFLGTTTNESLLLLQSFVGTVTTTTLILLGTIAQRDRAEHGLAEAIESLESRVRLRTQELAALNNRLQRVADIDALTGVANRRHFDAALDAEWRRCGRTTQSLAVILFDIDRFKAFNDTYGHPAGDDCLCRVAEALASGLLRSGELLARYGGEEFVALLPGLGIDEAEKTANRLRLRVADCLIPHAGSATGYVTSSAGVAAVVPVPHESPADLLQRADGALYRAKHDGRNRVARFG